MRRLVAAGAVVLVLVLLVVLVRGCVSSQRDQSLKDYNRNVRTLVDESKRTVATPLFEALRGAASQDPNRVQETLNELHKVAEEQVSRAEGLDVPDAMKSAQDDLDLVLTLRRDGVAKIADAIQPAIGRSAGAGAAVDDIAGQMQAFNASDVVYSQRVAPLILNGLKDNGIAASYSGDSGEQVAPYSEFLTDLSLMAPANVSALLGSSSGGTTDTNGRPAPGLHGHQIDSVSVGGTELSTDGSNDLPASPPPTFDVAFTNGGENDEQNVRVTVEISGSGAPLTASAVVPSTSAGEAATASVEFRQSPPTGGAVTIRVTIDRVPGEGNLDNNTAEYTALFE